MPTYKMTAEVPTQWVEVIHYVVAENPEHAQRIVKAIGNEPHLFHRQEDWEDSKNNVIGLWDYQPMDLKEMLAELDEMDHDTNRMVGASLADNNYDHDGNLLP